MFKKPVFLTLGAFIIGGGVGYYGIFDSRASVDVPEYAVPGGSSGGRSANSQIFQAAGDKLLSTPSVSNLDSLLQRYARLSPAEIREELLRLCRGAGQNNYQKDIAIQYLAFKLGQQAPDEVRGILENKQIDASSSLFSSLMCGWAERDVMGAMQYLLQHKRDYSTSPKVFDCLVDVMVQKRPDGVVSWSDTLSKGERRRALCVMVESIGVYHPDRMAAFASHIGSEAWKDPNLFSIIGKVWAKGDWDGFEKWTNTLDEGLQKKFLRDGFYGLSGVDLEKATEKYYLQSEEERPGIATAIVSGMDKSEKTSGRILDWMNDHLKDQEGINTVISSTLCFLEIRTPEFLQHLFDMPKGMVRDEALLYIVNSTVDMAQNGSRYMDSHANLYSPSFTDALDMASRISDQDKRDGSIRGCWKYWEEESSQEARQWIEKTSSLSSQEKQKLIQEQDARRQDH